FRNSLKNSMKWKALISIAFPLKLSGNMPVVQGQLLDFVLVTTNRNFGIMAGTMKIQVLKLNLLVRSSITHLVFTICMVMSGNGFRTGGMIIIKALLLMVVHGKMEIAPTLWHEVAVGTASLGIAVQRVVSGSHPVAATVVLVSVF
ncbi:MAG: hypothetical protein QG610_860, partial [Euryarchaeota archaeon]|nr:hypothetical protein [Euryarchaeota archaeon]